MEYKYLATCPEETKEVLQHELEQLGARNVVGRHKAVEFTADHSLAYRIHLRCGTASRFLRIVREAKLKHLKQIVATFQKIQWEEILKPKVRFRIKITIGDRGRHDISSPDIFKAMREAIDLAYDHNKTAAPIYDSAENQVSLVVFLAYDVLTVSIDTSGKALHKRGYRQSSHEAPLKETLANAILRLAGYDGSMPLLDPMCGTGTIPIEAAYIALNKATLIHRKNSDFGFTYLPDFDSQLWREIQDQERRERLEAPPAPIFASDISQSYVENAQRDALRARVEKYIQFASASFFDLEPPVESGIMVTNLPYDERLKVQGDFKEFYKKIGDTLKKKYAGWKVFLLVPDESPHKFIGLKPSRKIPLLNGSIPCKLLMFEIFAGGHASYKRALAESLGENDRSRD